MLGDDLQILVYDKNMVRQGSLGGASSVEFFPVANGVGQALVTIAPHRPRVADAMQAGARLVIDVPGVIRFSGPVVSAQGAGPGDASITLTVKSDARILWDWLAWPNPAAPIGSQGQAYAKYSGSAEKILKDVLNANKGRFPEVLSVAPNLNRGNVIPGGVQFRWHPIADRLMTPFEQAGLIVDVAQYDSQIVVDVREQQTVRKPLSVLSGNLTKWSWSNAGPTVTRVVAGGQGVGDLRTALQTIDTALESSYKWAVESFVDARDTDDPAEISGRMAEVLEDGAPKFGLTAELVQSESFRYGQHYQVGDKITVDVDGLMITDILREAPFRWSHDEGLQISPAVGERSDDPDLVLAKRVRAIQKVTTNLKVSQ
ncbi:hypothetical protein [Glutamicibacter sp. ZJUTW]|uniref:Gp37-like protein n=1 Tax=Glutamicibacter sp. ZJUTW TaxID=1155384 RepID=UPI0011F37C01|nr:hypothetical protein [Glutamicibacter sp. ZJUTW]QEP06193.1 hypothetical protein F0M17_02420 [Glutamicibacter sp. ZJUTW]